MNSGVAGASHTALMATFGGGAARHRQTYYSPWQAVLGTDAEERKALSQMFASDVVRPMLTSLRSRMKDDPIELLDAAYWMKGSARLGGCATPHYCVSEKARIRAFAWSM